MVDTNGESSMKSTAHIPHPKHCFCNISMDLLRKWFIRRHVEGVPTVQLLEMAESKVDKEAICAVAMFDIDKDSMLKIMANLNLPDNHIVRCSATVLRGLEFELLNKDCAV